VERQDGAAFCFQFVADAIDALAKLLDVFVGLEILGNLGVARVRGEGWLPYRDPPFVEVAAGVLMPRIGWT